MKQVTLSDGRVESFIVEENDYYYFWLCQSNSEACELNTTLLGLGHKCCVDFSCTLGWFVRDKK